MHNTKHVGVSTTQTIEGWAIDEYLGPIVVHTVAGSGLISDWLASWSDVLGGRSATYGKQLRSLSDEAIQSLRDRAAAMKANWVLGVTVDMDEISGQGKQMFMVTAMGTAVKAHRSRGSDGAPAVNPTKLGQVEADQVVAAGRWWELLYAMEQGSIRFDEGTWATLMEERPAAALKFVVAHVAASTSSYDAKERETAKAVAFVERLDPMEASWELHRLLDAPELQAKIAFDLIVKFKLRDLAEIRRRLAASPAGRPTAVQLLRAAQPYYELSDADILDEIAVLCASDRFPQLAKVIPGKGGLLGGGDSIQCICGERRGAKQTHCHVCARDVRGFRSDDLTPEAASTFCTSFARTVRFAFSSRK
jgi:uncharacterized protein YbjQ (UPF0145 family)